MSRGKRPGRWALFAFCAIDRRTAQVWLDQRCAAGWRLCEIRLGLLARFARDDRGIPRGCVRLQPARWEAEDSRRWTDAGWERTAQARGMDLFTSRPGILPVMPEEDSWEDYEAARRPAVRSAWGTALAVLLTAVWSGWLGWSALLLYNTRLAAGLALLLIDILLAAFGISAGRSRRLRQKALRQGGEMPAAPLWAARLRYGCRAALWLLVGALAVLNGAQAAQMRGNGPFPVRPLVETAELGLTGTGSAYARTGSSVLVSWVQTEALLRVDGVAAGTVVCDRYCCSSRPAASLLAALLRAEEAAGRTLHLLERHSGLSWEEMPPEQGRAWTAQDGGRTCLLVQEGNAVALIEAECPLTAPETVALLRERLFGTPDREGGGERP